MKEAIEKVKILIMDVDGVLTDGSIIIDDNGLEYKRFCVQDGHAIKMLQRAGYKTAIISGRKTNVTAIRAEQLGIGIVHQKCLKKLPVFEQILKDAGLTAEEAAFVGDDVIDLPLVKRAGLGVAVANAVDELKQHANFITERRGGDGAVREVIELILKTTGKWDGLMDRYLI